MAQQEQLQAARPLGFEIRDPERFAKNMARLVEETGRAVSVYMQPSRNEHRDSLVQDELAQVLKTLSQVQQAWLSAPDRVR